MVEDRRPGKIMLLCGINYNILISNPLYSALYQNESKKKDLQRDIFWGGWNQINKLTKMWRTLLIQ